MTAETALTTSNQESMTLLRPLASAASLRSLATEIDGIVAALVEGVDYGKIPGTPRATLLKPGAEKIMLAFGARPEYELVASEVDHDREVTFQKKNWTGTSIGLYRYVYKCRLVRVDGRKVGDADGSCSTMENKYVDRPRDCENTVIKMAQKRAMVAAVLNAFGLSNRFTQDAEDVHPIHVLTPEVKPAKRSGFDPSDAAHSSWLITELKRRNLEALPDTDKQRIVELLKGRPSSDLDAVLADVAFEEPAAQSAGDL